MFPRNPRERSAIVKGIAIGAFLGAFLPDNVNPMTFIRRYLPKG